MQNDSRDFQEYVKIDKPKSIMAMKLDPKNLKEQLIRNHIPFEEDSYNNIWLVNRKTCLAQIPSLTSLISIHNGYTYGYVIYQNGKYDIIKKSVFEATYIPPMIGKPPSRATNPYDMGKYYSKACHDGSEVLAMPINSQTTKEDLLRNRVIFSFVRENSSRTGLYLQDVCIEDILETRYLIYSQGQYSFKNKKDFEKEYELKSVQRSKLEMQQILEAEHITAILIS
jgi:hypothetical protein